jgi:hypothetical protein
MGFGLRIRSRRRLLSSKGPQPESSQPDSSRPPARLTQARATNRLTSSKTASALVESPLDHLQCNRLGFGGLRGLRLVRCRLPRRLRKAARRGSHSAISRRKLPTRIALRAGVILAVAGRSPYNQNLTASARTTGPRCIQMLRFEAEQGPRSPSNVPHQRPTRLIQLAWTAWKRTRRRRGPPFFIAS